MTLNAAFEEAIKVTPLDSHNYSTFLQRDWCVGTGTYSSLESNPRGTAVNPPS